MPIRVNLFSGGFNRIIKAEDAANLTDYDLTDFYINNYEENSDKNAFENKYLLCKRTVSIRELSRNEENWRIFFQLRGVSNFSAKSL